MSTRDVHAPTVHTIYNVAEVCQMLRISRWTFYRLVQHGALRTVTIGRRRLVAAVDLDDYVRVLRDDAS